MIVKRYLRQNVTHHYDVTFYKLFFISFSLWVKFCDRTWLNMNVKSHLSQKCDSSLWRVSLWRDSLWVSSCLYELVRDLIWWRDSLWRESLWHDESRLIIMTRCNKHTHQLQQEHPTGWQALKKSFFCHIMLPVYSMRVYNIMLQAVIPHRARGYSKTALS